MNRIAIPALLALLLAACNGMPRVTFEHAGKDDDAVAAADWQEDALALPAQPKPENLVGVYVSPLTPLSYAVDGASLSVAPDGTVRYTLLAVSEQGARNVSYEAIRCRTGETKRYAVAQLDGSWSRTRNPQWLPLAYSQVNGAQGVLARDFFCQGRTVDGNAANLLAKLRKNGLINSAQ